MIKKKWKWVIDQWLEDKVWVNIPKEHQSPHFFFLLGFVTAIIIFTLITLI
jgi:hypothetical protein